MHFCIRFPDVDYPFEALTSRTDKKHCSIKLTIIKQNFPNLFNLLFTTQMIEINDHQSTVGCQITSFTSRTENSTWRECTKIEKFEFFA